MLRTITKAYPKVIIAYMEADVAVSERSAAILLQKLTNRPKVNIFVRSALPFIPQHPPWELEPPVKSFPNTSRHTVVLDVG